MDIQFFGANCIRLSDKKATVVIDDNLAELGAKTVTKAGDVALFTGPHGSSPESAKITIDYPGEYEVSDVSIRGVAARGHVEEAGQKGAVVYRLIMDDLKIGILGHIYPELSDDQLEALGMIDVLFVPVGGSGYTLDGVGALKLIKKIEPKLVIPTHYSDSKLKFPVPQQPLQDALKNMSLEASQTVDRLKLKPADLTDNLQLIVLKPNA